MSWIGENLGAFSIIITVVVVIVGFIAFQQYAKALAEGQERVMALYKAENELLQKQIDTCRSEAGQFKRYKGTLRYALGRLGFGIIDNGDFITIIENDNKKTHTVRVKTTVDEQVESLEEDADEI